MIRRSAVAAVAVILGVITLPYFAYSDYPHTGVNSNGINCINCHTVHGALPDWATQTPTTPDDTPMNNLCLSCHNDVRAPYEKTHSSLNTSNTYGDWTLECSTCHNPHKQDQSRVYGSASYLYQGANTSVTSNTITRTGAGWSAGRWKGMLVIGDINAASPVYYKISDNTSDTLTVNGTIADVSLGSTFAIVYGALVTDTINYTKTNVTPTMNISRTVKFFTNTGTNSFADGTSTQAVCEVCHTQTKYHKNDGTGTSHNNGALCTTCHLHKDGFKPTGACDTCHGNPPTTSTFGGPSGLVGRFGAGDTGILGSGNPPTSNGAHNTHVNIRGMVCDVCHKGTTMPNTDNKIQMGFWANSATVLGWGSGAVTTGTMNLRTPNSPFSYQTYAGTTVNSVTSYANTCSSVYCHGSTLAGGSNTAPSWTGTNQAACGSCHSTSTGAGAPTLGGHTTHAGALALACTTCHPSVSDNSHVNGKVAWSISASDPRTNGATYKGLTSGDTGNLAPSSSYGNCSNIYCHSNVQGASGTGAPTSYAMPQWGGNNLNCGSCHRDMANDLSAPGSHKKHAQDNGYACSTCHNGAGHDTISKHANRNIDIAFDTRNPAGSYSLGSSVTPGSGYGTCATIYCHSDGKGNYAGTGGVGATPRWGDTSTGCNFCHKSLPTSGSHAAHVAIAATAYGSTTVSSTAGSYDFGCANCHPTNPANHVDGSVEIVLAGVGQLKSKNSPTAAYNSVTKTCTGVYCHSNGTAASAATATTPAWGQTFANVGGDPCAKCHANSPTGTAAHGAHAVGIHYDNVYTGTIGTALAGSGAANAHGNATTSTTINCNTCHYNTVQKARNKNNTLCAACHSGDAASTTLTGADLDKRHHIVNGTPEVSFAPGTVLSKAQLRDNITSVAELNNNWTRTNGYKSAISSDVSKATPTYSSGSCSSVSCHNGNAVSWNAGSLSCKACHTTLPF